jgi:hypothetical protein
LTDVSSRVQAAGRRAASDAAPWVTRLARMGYAAKGLVYLTIGGLSAQAAWSAGKVEGSEGALSTLRGQPFGWTLLAMMAVGLAGYVVWRVVQTAMDPENKGSDAKGLGARAGYAISAVAYAGLALEAVRLLSGGGRQGGGGSHWTGAVMEKPFGQLLVGAVGLGIAGYGLFQLYRGATSDIAKRLGFGGLDADLRRRIVTLGRVGTCARGVVFAIAGWMVILAALRHEPGKAAGLQGALVTLREQSHGRWLLGAAALGLMAYGVFQLAKARYRRIQPA